MPFHPRGRVITVASGASKPKRRYSSWASSVLRNQRARANGPVVDREADELHAEAAAADVRMHVDVREIRHGDAVR